MKIHHGDALDLITSPAWHDVKLDLVVTDPPYAFGGSGPEHALSATVAVVLRETAQRLKRGSYMLVFSASSFRSILYGVEAVRGILDPVRVGTWTKPEAKTKVQTAGWEWASVAVSVFRRGAKNREDLLDPPAVLDHITEPPEVKGRRAQLPEGVARWAVSPYAVRGGLFLDPFAGFGTLVTAAEAVGMNAHGFEAKL